MIINLYSIEGIVALVSSFVILIQLVLTLILGGIDMDADIDGDGFGDFDLGSIVSPKGILHFLFGSSWFLVLTGYPKWYFWLIAVGVGLITSLLVALLYWGMSKLKCEILEENGAELIGRSGTIYLPISDTTYEIFVNINGAKRKLSVKSKDSQKIYKTGDIVIITEYKNDTYFIN